MATATQGFDDDWSPRALRRLRPMNLYGWSKHLFDLALVDRARRGEKLPPQWAGLKFFNVFGPNEYHKGEMMSLVAKRFDDAKAGRPVRLFKSHRDGIGDGEQRRDFIYVDDAVAVVRWLLDTPRCPGIFNVGTGKARSFRELIDGDVRGARPAAEHRICRHAASKSADSISISRKPRSKICARAGYNAGFTPLEDAVRATSPQYPRSRRPLSLSATAQ